MLPDGKKQCSAPWFQPHATSVTPRVGSFDRFLNLQIALVIALQLLMCAWHSVANVIWRAATGYDRYYLGWWANVNGNYESGFLYWCVPRIPLFPRPWRLLCILRCSRPHMCA